MGDLYGTNRRYWDNVTYRGQKGGQNQNSFLDGSALGRAVVGNGTLIDLIAVYVPAGLCLSLWRRTTLAH